MNDDLFCLVENESIKGSNSFDVVFLFLLIICFFLLGFFVTNHGMAGEEKINSLKFRFRSIEHA